MYVPVLPVRLPVTQTEGNNPELGPRTSPKSHGSLGPVLGPQKRLGPGTRPVPGPISTGNWNQDYYYKLQGNTDLYVVQLYDV